MLVGIPFIELAWLAVAVIIGGIVTGILAGLFGIGGGAIIVPVLYEVFRVLGVPEEVRMQLCVGTSFAIILPTTIRSYLMHRSKGAVMHDVIRRWAVPAVAGVAIGSVIAANAPANVFKLVFIGVIAIIAFKLLFGRESWRIADDFPGRPGMTGYGLLIGLTSSLMGVSGGSVSNMIQTLHGKTIHNAVATSSGLGVPITIAGTLGYILAGLSYQPMLPPLSMGFVSLIGLAIIAPVSSFTAPYGARLAHALPRRKLEVGFGLFLIAVIVRLAISMT
jgi:uncharacterized membrane protein YfcA